MKTLSERLFKLSVLSINLTSLCLLVACQGGGFSRSAEEQLRPGTSAEPQVNIDQRKVELEVSGFESSDSELETPVERQSFYEDMMGQAPSYNEDELAQDAEDSYQNNLQKKREEEQRKKEQAAAPVPEVSPSKEAPPEEPAVQPEPPKKPNPEQPAPKPPETPVPPPKVKPQDPPPPQTQQPEVPVPAQPKKASSGDFCQNLNVARGQGEADLSELYNDDSQLAKTMPTDQLKQMRAGVKKNKFVCILLPIAIRMEEQVYRQRLEILRLKKKEANANQLTDADRAWLVEIRKNYNLDATAGYEELLARVDIIPLPMLLSQAALESGWGRSRATKELKNLFGLNQGDKSQPCRKNFGVGGACVREFSTIGESVSAYIRLLNVGKYYVKFRETRAQMRKKNQPLDSMTLLRSMPEYNADPVEYEKQINEIMNDSNRFGQYLFREDKVLTEPRS